MAHGRNLESSESTPLVSEDTPNLNVAFFLKWLDLTNKTESRDNDKSILGDFNFPLVYKMYATHFVKPSKKFKQQLKQY